MKNFEEINALINKNFELSHLVTKLLNDFNQTSDIASLDRAEEIQEQFTNNSREIARLRGEM